MIVTLTGRDLDREIVIALGWPKRTLSGNVFGWMHPNDVRATIWRNGDGIPEGPDSLLWTPRFHESLDASLAELWPVLLERGWGWFHLNLNRAAGRDWTRCEMGYPSHETMQFGDTAAEAFARCALMALGEEVR